MELISYGHRPNDKEEQSSGNSDKIKPPADPQAQIENNTSIVSDLIRKSQTSIEELKQNIQGKSGTKLIDFILEDIQELKRILFDPQSSAVFMAAINASQWINEKMNEWLGEKNAADILSQSVPNNITSRMGLALMDVADVIRPYRSVIDYLQHVKADDFLEKLVQLDDGQEARYAILSYLNKYGMRCSGEIDITKPRFSEKPTTLVPMILSNIKNFEPNSGRRKFEQGRQEALEKEKELLMKNEKKPRLLLVLEMLQRTDVEHPLNTTEIINKLKQCGVAAEGKAVLRDFFAENMVIMFGFHFIATGGRQFYIWKWT